MLGAARLSLAVALVGFALVLALPGSAAAPGSPPPGKVLLGVVGPDPGGFDRLTGHRHRLHLVFGAGTGEVGALLEQDRSEGRLTILTLNATGSPAAYARGGSDDALVTLSRAANEFGGAVWIRPMAEMNGHWSPWCAVTKSGRSKGAAYAASEYRRAFRRIAIVLRGGPVAAINARLRAEGMPPLSGAAASEQLPRSGQVALVWNPQGQGSPDVPGNRPADYWPGSGYVDYVGNDLYEIRGKAFWKGMDELYERFKKPYVIAEWAPWGYDSPTFVEQMFAWVAAHKRTVGLVYFNRGWSGGAGTFELARKQRALAAYRRLARHSRFGA